jgi:hypothetical protein
MWAWILFGIMTVIAGFFFCIMGNMATTITSLNTKLKYQDNQLVKINKWLAILTTNENELKARLARATGRRTNITYDAIPQDLISKLIVFCHPDKHSGDPKAGVLTQELLALRKK